MKGNRKREGKRTERTHRVTDRYVTNAAVSTRSTLHTVGFPRSSQQLQQQRTAAALWSVVCSLCRATWQCRRCRREPPGWTTHLSSVAERQPNTREEIGKRLKQAYLLARGRTSLILCTVVVYILRPS